jgi:spectinomycin phosphotransferase
VSRDRSAKAARERKLRAVHDAPPGLVDGEVLTIVRRHWPVEVDAVEHLPVGFGAHHWRALARGKPRLFVTLDALGAHHSAASLEAAYAAVAALDLDFVVASLPTRSGRYTVPLEHGQLSCAPWTAGTVAGAGPVVSDRLARANIDTLARLHAIEPPRAIRHWQPRVGPDFAASLAGALRGSWAAGPYGEPARAAITTRIEAIAEWTTRYHQLVDQAVALRWVPTHGEPHTRNQMITARGVRFVDWESFALAPRERDFGPLIEAGYADQLRPNWAMVEMYDLEWRLDEIAQYASWFACQHSDSNDGEVAWEALRHELDRPEWQCPP